MITALVVSLLLGFRSHGAAAVLTPSEPIMVPGGAGHFDFMAIDARNHLVLACHPGKSSIAVLDTSTGKATDLALGVEVNGVAADSANHRLYAAGPGKTLVEIDSEAMTKLRTLPLDGPGDDVLFDRTRGVIYVDNDDGTNLWIVDAKSFTLAGSVTIKEAPEVMEFDRGTDQIYQAIKSTATVQVISAADRKVTKEFTLGTLTSPHGLVLDTKARRIYVVGKNGKLVVLDSDSGKLLNTIQVAPKSDQIGYDPGNKRIYIPAEGAIQVIQIDGDNGTIIGSVPVAKDCHRVVVDRRTHEIYVAYSENGNSYFQKFTAQ